ncbi:hypothetical protein SUDANB120_02953 [Streptomyces sp. enrichment culture]|uniref:hypothetical protein n=1 Tax=Streptomyces sp. enrichment culture TaxID=1795815 RepID=UPI003F54BC4D
MRRTLATLVTATAAALIAVAGVNGTGRASAPESPAGDPGHRVVAEPGWSVPVPRDPGWS